MKVEWDVAQEAGAVFERVGVRALHLARLVAGTTAEAAQDAVQEAGLRYLAALKRGVRPDNTDAYYLTCVLNESRRTRARAISDRELLEQLSAFSATQPSMNTEMDVEALQLWTYIEKLPPRQRSILGMRFYVGMSTPAIAAAIGCRNSTVRSNLTRAISSLRKMMPDETS